jgi:hypothetical protein
MTDHLARLRRDYMPPFLAYLSREDEASLRSAYELGRDAMSRRIGLLDLVRVHNDALLEVVRTAPDVQTAGQICSAASTFLAELLAAFEMAQRGYQDIGLRQQGRRRPAAPPPPAAC